MFDPSEIRKDFPILSRKVRGKALVYLDNAATTQKPRQVIEALKRFYETSNANVHRGVHTLSDEATALVENGRAAVARFVHAAPEEVVFTRNATEAINLVAYAWGRKFLKAGDEVVLTELEHHSNLVPWQICAQATGAVLRFIPVTPSGQLDLDAARALIGPRTRLVAFTGMSNALGTLTPVSAIVKLARAAGAAVLIDGAQLVPHAGANVEMLDCDFLAFSAHKMLGPTGVGVLVGRRKLLEAMDPFLGGGDMIQSVTLERSTWNVLPHKFEAGTPNIADTAAFAEAVAYLERVGFTAIREHEKALTQRTLELLKAEGDVTLYGPSDPALQGGVVSFNIEGLHPHDVGQLLDAEGVAVRVGHHCAQPLMKKLGVPGTARASFYLYNTLDEVETFVKAVRKAKTFFKVGSRTRI